RSQRGLCETKRRERIGQEIGVSKKGTSGMPQNRTAEEEQVDLLKKILIVQLGLAGVPQAVVRKIVGGDIGRINEVMKHLPKSGA
ncbi:MAG: hypothetical protein ACRDGA_12385, partial [Bacteroidota bacterium]